MKRILLALAFAVAVTSAVTAGTKRYYRGNSRARDAGAIVQGIGGLIGGLSEAASRQQQQQQQQQIEYQRQRQAELQRQRLEAERLERQRDLEVQQRQYELEKQRLALDRQRWREEADKQGIEICGCMIPSWLWQSTVASAVFGALCLLLKFVFGHRN